MKKLTKLRDAEAEKFYKDSGWVPSEWAVMNFKAGWDARNNLDNEALKIAVEALELCHSRMKMTAWIEDECFWKIEEALAEIRKLRGE